MNTPSDSSESSGIVRIIGSDDDTHIGMGVAVGAHHVLTCAHVVNQALGRDNQDQRKPTATDVVSIISHFHKGKTTGEVTAWGLSHDVHLRNDVAVLLLREGLPANTGTAYFGSATGSTLSWQALGIHGDAPKWVGGTLSKDVDQGVQQLDGKSGATPLVDAGYSGAAVWCPELRVSIGMVIGNDTDHLANRVSFMIPTETLVEFCRDLPIRRHADSLPPPPAVTEKDAAPPPRLRRRAHFIAQWRHALHSCRVAAMRYLTLKSLLIVGVLLSLAFLGTWHYSDTLRTTRLVAKWISVLAAETPSPTTSEIDTLWEISQSPPRDRLAFLKTILRDRDSIARFNKRYQYFIHAVTQLDPTMRAQVVREVFARYPTSDLSSDKEAQLAHALLGTDLAVPAPDFTAKAVRTIAEALDRASPDHVRGLAGALNAACAHIDSPEAAELASSLASTFVHNDNADSVHISIAPLRSAIARINTEKDAGNALIAIVRSTEDADATELAHLGSVAETLLPQLKDQALRDAVTTRIVKAVLELAADGSPTYEAHTLNGFPCNEFINDSIRPSLLETCAWKVRYAQVSHIYSLVSVAYYYKVYKPDQDSHLIEAITARAKSLKGKTSDQELLSIACTLCVADKHLKGSETLAVMEDVVAHSDRLWKAALTSKRTLAYYDLTRLLSELDSAACERLCRSVLTTVKAADARRTSALTRTLKELAKGDGKDNCRRVIDETIAELLGRLEKSVPDECVYIANAVTQIKTFLTEDDAHRAIRAILQSQHALRERGLPRSAEARFGRRDAWDSSLEVCLSELAEHISRSRAADTASLIISEMSKCEDDELRVLVESVEKMRAKVDGQDNRAKLQSEALNVIARRVAQTEPGGLDNVVDALKLIGGEDVAGQTATAITTVLESMSVLIARSNTEVLCSCAGPLGTLSKLDPDQAGRLTKQLAVLLSDALMRADGKQKIIIAVAIGEVAAGLDEESAAKRASAILPLVDQADETERWKLCHAIPNVIDRAGAKRNELLRLHALQLLSFLENASDISRMGNISWYLYEVVNKLGPTDKLSLVPRIVALNDRPTSERAVGLRMSLQQGTQFLNQEAGLRFVDDYFGAAERRNEGYLWFDLIGAKDMPAALSDKALVKLLASPTCVGNYRQFILARLETRLAKTFNDDRWNFVAAWINERGEQVVKPRRASY